MPVTQRKPKLEKVKMGDRAISSQKYMTLEACAGHARWARVMARRRRHVKLADTTVMWNKYLQEKKILA
jgi:hypothetical protein